MASRLEVVPFDASRIEAVANFNCGSEPWSVAATIWIAAPLEFNGALKSIRDHGTKVWLFYLGPLLVGFGSLGRTTSPWPAPTSDAKEVIGYIPQVAIDCDFHGQPPGSTERFSTQIMSHILAVAASEALRFVGLRVDADNAKAIKFYQRIGFSTLPGTVNLHGREFVRMIIRLSH
jgi:GNAT superfamily N-acetyltransferase